MAHARSARGPSCVGAARQHSGFFAEAYEQYVCGAILVFEKLQTDYQRFLEIEKALLDPDITADARRVRELSKERGALAKVALSYGRYLDLGRQISEARYSLGLPPFG